MEEACIGSMGPTHKLGEMDSRGGKICKICTVYSVAAAIQIISHTHSSDLHLQGFNWPICLVIITMMIELSAISKS